jgi:hypothetical protein
MHGLLTLAETDPRSSNELAGQLIPLTSYRAANENDLTPVIRIRFVLAEWTSSRLPRMRKQISARMPDEISLKNNPMHSRKPRLRLYFSQRSRYFFTGREVIDFRYVVSCVELVSAREIIVAAVPCS